LEAAAVAAEEAAAAAAAEVEAAANAALEEAQAAAEEALGQTADVAEEAAEAVETDTATEEAVEEVATEAAEGSEDLMAMAGDLLTVDGFDADKVVALLDTIDIPEGEKTTLTTALGFAKDNPALLQPVLDNIKNLLGM
jgi:hypothetical protein